MNRKNGMFYLGLFLLIGFVFTGMYLRYHVKPALGDDIAHRMMARANHLYLLFISLLIMTASQIDVTSRAAWIRRTTATGKLLLCASGLLLALAVFTDHSGGTRDRVTTFYGCIAALAGGLALAAGVFGRRDSGAI
ncbi:MAG: hypothetical protein JF616_05075 [Fibrobacteres bacterium]|jgi:hypothetical protein|nr:hypothetical protein [Fibrobacterota bacterium]